LNFDNKNNDKQRSKPLSPRARLLRSLLPAIILTLVIVVIYVLKIWKYDPQYERDASAENRLAIMYFDNKLDSSDPDRMGETITNLLITDLSESHYMSVVTGQHLFDILKQLSLDSTKTIDNTAAYEIAVKADARWILLGEIVQLKPSIILSCRIMETESGQIIASPQITGKENESVFELVDRLTVEVKKNLPLSAAALEEHDLAIADATTPSLEAYRSYIIGLRFLYRYFWDNARYNISQATRADSTFASAYARLAYIADDSKFQRDMIRKAVEYSDKVGIYERYFILGLDGYISGDYERSAGNFKKLIEHVPDNKIAHYYLALIYRNALGQNDKAVFYLNKLIELDPNYVQAYNLLAFAYDALGEFENSIAAIDKFISYLPDKAYPYDSRGDIYANNGRLDEAIKSYEEALAIEPAYEVTPGKLGNMYIFKREYKKAESLFKKQTESPDLVTRSFGCASLSDILVHRGKFKKALDNWNDCITTDSSEIGHSRILSNRIMSRIELYIRLNKLTEAETERERYSDYSALNDKTKDWIHVVRGYEAWMAATAGDFVTADTILNDMSIRIGKNVPLTKLYELIKARVNYLEGKFVEARAYFEKENDIAPSFENQIMIARCFLGEKKYGEASAMFEKAMTRYDYSRAYNGLFAVKAHYWLGLTYEELNQNKKAINRYQTFLDIWKNADPGVAEIDDARKRLAKLKSSS